MIETWRDTERGGYQVSDFGRVRSVERTINGRSFKGKTLKPQGHPYLHVALGAGNLARVHVLVLRAFAGRCPEGMEGCHGDGDRTNNRLENLRWDTRKANHADKAIHGTQIRGSGVHLAKLTDDDIRCIRAEPEFRGVQRMLARCFRVNQSNISQIRLNKTWRHVN